MALDLNPANNDTSTLLDALRALASFAVLIGHGISFFGVAGRLQPPHFPYVQNLAVIGFFVLSGFLIASVLDRSSEGIGGFLIDRVARIYSGFVPSMMLIAALAWALYAAGLNHETPTFLNWFQNLLMLNAYSGSLCPEICARNFSTAGHVWSLGVEFHIYLFVGFAFYAIRNKSLWLAAAALLCAKVPFLYLTSAKIHPGTNIFYVWLFGFAGYHLLSRIEIPRRFAWIGLAVSLAMFAVTVQPRQEYDVVVYIWTGIAFTLLVAATQTTRFFTEAERTKAVVRSFANFSFTLYLVHHPIQFAIHSAWPDSGWSGAAAGLLIPIPVATVIAHLGEMHYRRVARTLKAALLERPSALNHHRGDDIA